MRIKLGVAKAEQRFIKLDNKYVDGKLILTIRNSKIPEKNGSLETTKKEGDMHMGSGSDHIESIQYMTTEQSSRKIEFVLHIVEQILKGQDSYLNR